MFMSKGTSRSDELCSYFPANNVPGEYACLFSFRRWSEELVDKVCQLLAEDLPLPPGVPGGMESYRRTLTTSFFFKFYLSVLLQLQDRVSVEISG